MGIETEKHLIKMLKKNGNREASMQDIQARSIERSPNMKCKNLDFC